MYSCDIWCVTSSHPQVTTQVMFPSICTLFFFSRLAFQKESFVFPSLFIHNGLLSAASTWVLDGFLFPLYLYIFLYQVILFDWQTFCQASYSVKMSHDLPYRLRFQTKIMKKPILFCNGTFSLYVYKKECIDAPAIYANSVQCFLKGWTSKMMLISVLFTSLFIVYLNFPLNSTATHYRVVSIVNISLLSLWILFLYNATKFRSNEQGII